MIRAISSLAVASSMALSSVSAMSHTEAASNIRKHVESFSGAASAGKSLCTEYTCCTVSATESCGLSSMPKDDTTLVLPGGNTRCIFSTSTPFAFQVVPGDSDKVLFYFQGGGACWDAASTKGGFCTTDSAPQGPNGVFDRNNDKNAFKDYTIVHVLYCSGDIHGGNVVRDYNDSSGVPVTQRGFSNAESALNWIIDQQATGALASTLSSLVVMGCSAGSIGAQIWANQAVTKLKWKEAAVVPDSYAGVFPEGSQGPLIYGFGMCSVFKEIVSAESLAKCEAQTLTLQDINAEFIPATPSVPFSFIQSKTDIVQISFYTAVGLSMHLPAVITPAEFYDDVNTIFEGYNPNPNFLTYLVSGDQHCFTPMNLYFTADAVSAEDNGASSSKEMMHTWTGNFPLESGQSESTVCEGTVQSSSRKAFNNETYCSEDLVPKTFTEKWN